MARKKELTKDLVRQVEDLDTDGMDGRWFSECSNETEKANTKQVLLNSSIQFRLLKLILQREFASKQLQPTDFHNPTFDQKRLYNEGYLRALQEIYKILP